MSNNPLAKHFRQPAIYIKLPSKGTFWPEGSLDLPLNEELPVYPMTTKDELLLKTPDALMNGSGVVDVIQSCCPNIKDAWKMPSIDVDTALIAIRIASSGDRMDFDAECPYCKFVGSYAVSLSGMLGSIISPDYSQKFHMNGLKIKLRPQTYFDVNAANQITFQQEKLLSTMRATDIDDEVRAKIMEDTMVKINELAINSYANSIEYIEMEDSTIVSDKDNIIDYFKNSSSETIRTFNEKLREFADIVNLKPIHLTCENEECKKEFKTKLEFDYADFFGAGS